MKYQRRDKICIVKIISGDITDKLAERDRPRHRCRPRPRPLPDVRLNFKYRNKLILKISQESIASI